MTSLTYSSYLKVEELLALQQPQSEGPEHDEVLFIIIHQVYELWFKELLHELDYVQQAFRKNNTARVLQTLKRVLVIFKTLIAQIDVLETMTPLEFLAFRGRLDSASGFQSAQFRAIEFALGYKRRALIQQLPADAEMRRQLEERFQQPSLWDSFLHYLARSGYPVPAHLLTRDVTQPYQPSLDVQRFLIEVYRYDLTVTQVCERLLDLDESIQEWRYRHVKMVERTIGTRQGTGGSAGVEYLKTTLFKPLFPDLWAIRTQL
jgi:tryptophan 2,3-dioxygenase